MLCLLCVMIIRMTRVVLFVLAERHFMSWLALSASSGTAVRITLL